MSDAAYVESGRVVRRSAAGVRRPQPRSACRERQHRHPALANTPCRRDRLRRPGGDDSLFTPPGLFGSKSTVVRAHAQLAGADHGTIELRGPRGAFWVEAHSTPRRVRPLTLTTSPEHARRDPRRARRNCSTPPRNSAGSASGSPPPRPAKVAGTSMCSTSGASTLPKERRTTARRSSASIRKTARPRSMPTRRDASAATRSATASSIPTAGRAGSTRSGR